jgi:hypothetical protein
VQVKVFAVSGMVEPLAGAIAPTVGEAAKTSELKRQKNKTKPEK